MSHTYSDFVVKKKIFWIGLKPEVTFIVSICHFRAVGVGVRVRVSQEIYEIKQTITHIHGKKCSMNQCIPCLPRVNCVNFNFAIRLRPKAERQKWPRDHAFAARRCLQFLSKIESLCVMIKRSELFCTIFVYVLFKLYSKFLRKYKREFHFAVCCKRHIIKGYGFFWDHKSVFGFSKKKKRTLNLSNS